MKYKKSFFLILFFCFTTSFYAQEEVVLDKTSEISKAKMYTAPIEDQTFDKNKVLVKQLTKLTLINDPYKFNRDASRTKVFPYNSGEIVVDSFTIPKEKNLINELKSYLGTPITINNLDKIRAVITKHYQDQGYPVVGVSVPAKQVITRGQVQVLILVAKLEKVKSTGAKWFSNKKIAEQVRLKPGQEITSTQILEDLDWLNNNPFRKVDLLYERGETLSQTNMIFETTDRFPLRVYGGIEHTGNIVAGENRWLTGFNWGDAWGIDHQINGQFMCADRFSRWWGLSGNYVAPLPWRDIFKVFGSFVKTKPDAVTDRTITTPMEMRGKNWTVGARYFVRLPVFVSYKHKFFVGYDFKRTNNFLSFSLTMVYNYYIDVSQFLIGYEASNESSIGNTLFGLTFYMSPGKMTHYNTNRYYEQERSGASANYFYARATIDHLFPLHWNTSWALSSLFQWTSGKLLPSEQLSSGGFLSVRGYDENEIISDRGFQIKNEYRFPKFSIIKKGNFKDEMQILFFFDFAFANDVDQEIFSKESTVLASIGPGIRYNIYDYLNFRVDYGIQLNDMKNRPFTSGDRSRFHVGFVAAF